MNIRSINIKFIFIGLKLFSIEFDVRTMKKNIVTFGIRDSKNICVSEKNGFWPIGDGDSRLVLHDLDYVEYFFHCLFIAFSICFFFYIEFRYHKNNGIYNHHVYVYCVLVQINSNEKLAYPF